EEARRDVLLGLEMVVEGGLGHAELLGDLPKRRVFVAVLAEELDRGPLDPLASARLVQVALFARRFGHLVPQICSALLVGRDTEWIGRTAGSAECEARARPERLRGVAAVAIGAGIPPAWPVWAPAFEEEGKSNGRVSFTVRLEFDRGALAAAPQAVERGVRWIRRGLVRARSFARGAESCPLSSLGGHAGRAPVSATGAPGGGASKGPATRRAGRRPV